MILFVVAKFDIYNTYVNCMAASDIFFIDSEAFTKRKSKNKTLKKLFSQV